jgi:hypothetical protein
MELLIALVLLSMIVLGIANIEIFCKQVFMGADRKTTVINEATYIVEHMSKYIGRAIGDARNLTVNSEDPVSGCDNVTRVWIDYTETGVKDNGDREIVYCFNNASHTLKYYPNYQTWVDPGPPLDPPNTTSEVLSRNTMVYDVAFASTMGYVDVTVATCWNASISCGTIDNPRVSLQTRIVMPSVSINSTNP